MISGGSRPKMAKKNVPTLPEKPPTTTTKDNAVPKSFIFKKGKVTKNTAQLILDLRRVMEPNTATKLRERAANRLKDYMSVAGPLGVSHFMTFSQGEESLSLRMARFSGGPTCHFKVWHILCTGMSWECKKDQDLLDRKPSDLLHYWY